MIRGKKNKIKINVFKKRNKCKHKFQTKKGSEAITGIKIYVEKIGEGKKKRLSH